MNREQKLVAYSLSASVFLVLNNTSRAQAIYIDIDPDTVIQIDQHYYLNFDNTNELIDIVFSNLAFTTYYEDNYVWRISVNPINNIVAATMHYDYPGYLYLPYALSPGVLIDTNLLFYQGGHLKMAYRTGNGPSDVSFTAEGGFWYPEKLDHYVGIRFADSLMCNHYGWIRCDVTDSGTVLTIKDYAFEMKCDVGIIAGDTIGDTTHVNIDDNFSGNLDAAIYTFNNELFIITNSLEHNYTVHIRNLAGVVLLSNNFTSQKTNINLESFASGIYFVEVADGNNFTVRKIVISK